MLHRCFLAWRCTALAGRPRLAAAAAAGSGGPTLDRAPDLALAESMRLLPPRSRGAADAGQRSSAPHSFPGLAASGGGAASARVALRSPLGNEEPRAVLAVRPRSLPAPGASGRARVGAAATQERPCSMGAASASQLSRQYADAGGLSDAASGSCSRWTTASAETAALLQQDAQPAAPPPAAAVPPAMPSGAAGPSARQIAQVKASLLAALEAGSGPDSRADAAGPQPPAVQAQTGSVDAAPAPAGQPLPRTAKAGPGAGRRSGGSSAPAWLPGSWHSSTQPFGEPPAGIGKPWRSAKVTVAAAPAEKLAASSSCPSSAPAVDESPSGATGLTPEALQTAVLSGGPADEPAAAAAGDVGEPAAVVEASAAADGHGADEQPAVGGDEEQPTAVRVRRMASPQLRMPGGD